MTDSFIQFELWKDCKNNCQFCFNQNQVDVNKEESLKFVIDTLKSPLFNYNEVGIIGGEFFDGQLNSKEAKTLFLDMLGIICNKIRNGCISKFYLATSLLFANRSSLCEALQFLKEQKCLDRTLLCTSFDVIGRFQNMSYKELWKLNIDMLSHVFPELKKHVEIIMTGAFMSQVWENQFSISSFRKKFCVSVDFLEPFAPACFESKQQLQNILPNFFPERKKFIDFILEHGVKRNDIDISSLFSKKLRSNFLYYVVDGKHKFIQNRHKNDNCFGIGSSSGIPKFGYIDSDIQMCEDVDHIRRQFECGSI